MVFERLIFGWVVCVDLFYFVQLLVKIKGYYKVFVYIIIVYKLLWCIVCQVWCIGGFEFIVVVGYIEVISMFMNICIYIEVGVEVVVVFYCSLLQVNIIMQMEIFDGVFCVCLNLDGIRQIIFGFLIDFCFYCREIFKQEFIVIIIYVFNFISQEI